MIYEKKSLTPFVNSLTGKLYKILPLYEEKNLHLKDYVHSLEIQMEGFAIVSDLKNNIDYVGILSTLAGLGKEIEILNNQKVIKREVFKMIRLSKDIQQIFQKEGE